MQDINIGVLDDDDIFVGIDWGGSHHQLCVVSDRATTAAGAGQSRRGGVGAA
ncbi:MAG: hypothetical protein M3P83_02275 [Actinomycetota bacterium]|nr:hypothetical protein [Actinomycetota bacterium]